MSKGFQQPSPERREALRIEMARDAGRHVELDFCDGCGARFRSSPLNAPGVCSMCAPDSVYAVRYDS